MPRPASISSLSVTPATGSVGTTFSVSISATGRKPIDYTYRWRLDGTNIPGATAATFVSTQPGELSVKVTATNNWGTDSQVSAPVTVTPASFPPGKHGAPDNFRHRPGRTDLEGVERRRVVRLSGSDPDAELAAERIEHRGCDRSAICSAGRGCRQQPSPQGLGDQQRREHCCEKRYNCCSCAFSTGGKCARYQPEHGRSRPVVHGRGERGWQPGRDDRPAVVRRWRGHRRRHGHDLCGSLCRIPDGPADRNEQPGQCQSGKCRGLGHAGAGRPG